MNDGILGNRSGVGVDFESDLKRRPLRRKPPETGIGLEQATSQESDDVCLLCGTCDVVYEQDDDWNNCPRCGDELREVERA